MSSAVVVDAPLDDCPVRRTMSARTVESVEGELVPVEMPWQIDPTLLTPTEYRYLTGY